MSLSKLKKKINKKKNKFKKTTNNQQIIPRAAVDFNPVKTQNSLGGKVSRTQGFLNSLYDNEGELLFQTISFMPLAVGSWIAGGASMHNPLTFVLLMSVMILGHYLTLIFKERLFIKYSKKTFIYSALLSLVLCAGLIFVAQNVLFGVLAFLYYWLQIQDVYLSSEKVSLFFIKIISLLSRMSLLAVLGAFSQVGKFIPIIGIFGFIPACYLAASLVVQNKDLLLAHGWKKVRFAVKENSSKSMKRPGSLTQLFVILLILGPSVSIISVPLRWLPDQMLITVIPLYFMPNIANAFLEEFKNKRVIAMTCLNHALLSTFLVLVAGLI